MMLIEPDPRVAALSIFTFFASCLGLESTNPGALDRSSFSQRWF
jgi:hypothetical protein